MKHRPVPLRALEMETLAEFAYVCLESMVSMVGPTGLFKFVE